MIQTVIATPQEGTKAEGRKKKMGEMRALGGLLKVKGSQEWWLHTVIQPQQD